MSKFIQYMKKVLGIYSKRRCRDYEDDISAEKYSEKKSSWFQSENEQRRRKKVLAARRDKGRARLSA